MQLSLPWRYGNTRPFSSRPRINWDHPLAQGLVFYHYDMGDGGYDLAGSRQMTWNTATRLNRSNQRWGMGYVGNGSASDAALYASDTKLRAAPPMSWACGFSKAASATEEGDGIFGRAANSIASAPFYNWGIADNFSSGVSGPNIIQIYYNNAGTLGQTSGATLGLNQYHAVVASAPSTATINWWADGAAQTSATGLTLQNVTTGDNIVMYSDFGGPGGFQGNIYWAAFWNRALNAQEARLLYLDPYCLLWYPEDDVFATLVGTTTPVTVNFMMPVLEAPFSFWRKEMIAHD